MGWKFWRRGRPEGEADIRDELASHVSLRTEEYVARGLPPEEARAEAERRFGPVAPVARALARIERRRTSLVRALAVDLHHALRAIVRAPLASAAGAIVMAIGLATVSAAWLVRDALLYTPPAGVARPGELYSALEALDYDGPKAIFFSYQAFRVVAEAVPEASPFAWGSREVQVARAGSGRPMAAALVSAGYFDALGLVPWSGRLLDGTDARERHQAAVLSQRAARALAANPASLIGQRVTINGQPFEIAGIAPPRFHGLEAGHPVDLWLPLDIEPAISTVSVLPDGRAIRGYNEGGMGWLRGGVRITAPLTAEQVAARMSAAARDAAPTEELRAITSVVLTDRIWISPWSGNRERLDAVLEPLRLAAALTLLLTSACLGSLLLGRLADRRAEFGVRLALGGGRLRLVRLVGFEIAAVCTACAVLAWLLAQGILHAASGLVLGDGITVGDAISTLGARAVLIVAGLSGAVALLAGVAPLSTVARLSAAADLAAVRTTATGTTFRRVLIAAQVAVGCALVAGAAMLTQSLTALRAQPLGFEPGEVSFVELNPSGAGLADDEVRALAPRLAAAAPGGAPLAFSDELPFGGSSTIYVQGEDAERTVPLPVSRIAGAYFETLGVELIAGRPFDSGAAGQQVAIISAPLAKALWPGENAVGRIIRIGTGRGRPYEVVGVVAGLRDGSLRRGLSQRVYLPLGEDVEKLVVLARTGASAAASTALVDLTHRIDPRLVALQTGPLTRLIDRSLEQQQALQMVSGAVGLGSLLMVAIGVWGLSHEALRRRWRELGIRLALGATPRQAGQLALREATIVASLGGAAGLLTAWQFGRTLQAWLFGVSPADPWLLGLAAGLLSLSAFAGAVAPARQAMRADPAALLRER